MRFWPPCIALALCLLASLTPAQAAYDRQVPADYVPRLLRGGPSAYFSEMNSGWREEHYANLR